jgi:hypothetical protein
MAEMDMVERVARAIYEGPEIIEDIYATKWDDLRVKEQGTFRDIAIRAIEAMRVPTEAMIDAYVREGHGKTVGDVAVNGYRAMISAALSDTRDKG